MMNSNDATNTQAIWKVALPLFLGRAAEVMAAAVDTMSLGHFEGNGIEAIGYATVFLSIVITFAFGFSKGTQILIAQSLGDKEELQKIFKSSLAIIIVLSILMAVAMPLLTPWLIDAITSSPNVASLTIDYLMVRYWGIPFIFINTLFVALFAARKKTSIVLKGTLVLVLFNWMFNYIFVFGNFGAPVLGMKGAGVATVISEAILFIYYALNLSGFGLTPGFRGYISWEQIKKTITLSIPLGARNMVSIAGFFVFFWLIEGMDGDRPSEVSSVMEKIFALFMIPAAGFQAATNIFVGEQFSAKKYAEILPLTHRISQSCVLAVGLIVLPCFLFPEVLISLFIDEGKEYLIQDVKPVVYVLGMVSLLVAWEKVIIDAISGMGKTDVSFYIEIIATVSYVSLAYILITNVDLSIAEVWSVEFFYAIVLGGISYVYLVRFIKKKQSLEA